METSGQNHLEGLIVALYMCVSQVTGGSLVITASPMFPLESTAASLTCHIPLFTGGAEWIKKGSSLTVCLPGSCIPPSSTRCQYSANATSITVTIPSLDKAHDEGTWTCAYNGGTDTGIYYLTVYSTTSISSPPNALGKRDGAVFIILDICIIISYIIMVILITDLIIWNKNSTISIFMACVKTGHQCLRILHIVLMIVVVVCEIIIIIMIIISCQCQTILIAGLVLGLIIIAVTIIFLVVFIKTGVIICNKDTVRNPRTSTDVKITAYHRPMFISDLEWIGPKGNTLSAEDEEKYIIAKYNINTGETSLTITNVSQDDNGPYICQAKIGCKIAKDSIYIMCADKEMKTKNSGSSGDVSTEHVQIQMKRKGVKSDDEERPPAIHIGTQIRVDSEPTSKKTRDRPQPLPPVAVVTEDIPNHRPRPPPPENSDVKGPNQRAISANVHDKQGLLNEPPRSRRLTLPSLKPATVDEEEPKKKRKKKRKKGQMNEENQEVVKLRSKRTFTEDQSDGD